MRAEAKVLKVLGAGVILAGCSSAEPGSDVAPNQSLGGAGGSTSAVVRVTGGTSTSSRSSSAGGAVGSVSLARGTTVVGTATGGESSVRESQIGGASSKSGAGSKGGASSTSATSAQGGTTSAGGTSGGTSSTSKATSAGTSSAGGATTTSGTGTGDVSPSKGCGKAPTLKSGTVNLGSRNYILKLPTDYDSSHPYRLILGLHGYGGSSTNIQSEKYFGLEPLSNGSTIFIAPNAVSNAWNASTDVAFVDQILEQVEADLCIDMSRVMLEGFSQGAAMSWSIACTSQNVFRAVIGHSGGGVANPTSCKPVAYLGSLGLDESGNSQKTQTDQFAKWNGCTIETLPTAPNGSHVCTNYSGCPAAAPVRWCSYDGGHTSAPNDAGQGSSWMPKEVWAFVSQF